jgi:lipopolysaccharide transport system ATP-binding protein
MAVAIKVDGLSKAYQLGQIGTGTISRDLERWMAKIRGKEDPFLKIGETNDRTTISKSNVVWSLKDINFEIQQGDALGIVGRNGAGKSTLLKLLSRVTSPTTGTIKAKGRIASLLEVGTGFHPELTGRENIYLNGAILGMRKKEIDKKFDEIVDFSGVERYIDTPVKRYSSGMYVRLAFAVAANLDSEILIVDEVLAVGDAEFQKKCLGKMNDLSKGQGRTVLFVSHNMGVVTQLCRSAILLNKGSIAYMGNADAVVQKYLSLNANSDSYVNTNTDKKFYVAKADVLDEDGNPCNTFGTSNKIYFQFSIAKNISKSSVKLSCTIQNKTGDYLSTFVEDMDNWFDEKTQQRVFQVAYPGNLLSPNYYAFRLALFASSNEIYDLVEMICSFSVIDEGSSMAIYEGASYGYFFANHELKSIL